MESTRDLSAVEQKGKALIESHKNFDLTTDEVHKLFDTCHITDEFATAAFDLMHRTFAIGIEAGRRMVELDADDVLADISVSLDKAQTLTLDLQNEYFPLMQPFNRQLIECEFGRICTYMDITSDYINKAQIQVNRLIG